MEVYIGDTMGHGPFVKCSKSPDGTHCFHSGICCWCGQRKSYDDYPRSWYPYGPQRGRRYPEDLVLWSFS